VGELLANQCRVGLARTERLVKERMTLFDQSMDSMTPQKLINPKALVGGDPRFLRAQPAQSQFMDQINPLAELTHKRRLSALGPGGLSRDRAGFEVRDVHPSHYGRICPIETPEGPNIGLIASLATFARINDFGFIETPYRKVENGRVTDAPRVSHGRSGGELSSPRPMPIDDKGQFLTDRSLPSQGRLHRRRAEAGGLHGRLAQAAGVRGGWPDSVPGARRREPRLMGSNMQRQAVPLVDHRGALGGHRLGRTGGARFACGDWWPRRPARWPLSLAIRSSSPTTDCPEGKKKIQTRSGQRGSRLPVRKFMRSNAATCINQKSLVAKGDHVKKGQIIADGPCTSEGELALGRNVLVAFMPWNGYNFEDAILISERIVKDDVFTSIHIDEFEVGARDTKLGPEEITRDIPNLGEEVLKNLGPTA
jgi:DNA-directed RNA polymerase subunit beta